MPQGENEKAKDLVEELIDRIEGQDEAPDLMVIEADLLEVTVGELRELINRNPVHPISVVFGKGTQDYPDEHLVNIEKIDLLSMIENFEVIRHKRIIGGVPTWVKEPGKSLGPPLEGGKLARTVLGDESSQNFLSTQEGANEDEADKEDDDGGSVGMLD